MANELDLLTADRVEQAQGVTPQILPCIALEAIEAGAPVRYDPSTTTGKVRNANGSDMTEGKLLGIALKSVAANEPVSVMMYGLLDGFNLDALAFGATIYLSDTDARISNVAGTKAVTVGYVAAGHANLIGETPKKLLLVDTSLSAAIT